MTGLIFDRSSSSNIRGSAQRYSLPWRYDLANLKLLNFKHDRDEFVLSWHRIKRVDRSLVILHAHPAPERIVLMLQVYTVGLHWLEQNLHSNLCVCVCVCVCVCARAREPSCLY